MQVLILITLLAAVLVAVFALQNAYPVTINFLSWQFEASLALVILVSVLAGAALFGVFGITRQAQVKIDSWRQRRKLHRQRRELEKASEDVLSTNELLQQETRQRGMHNENREGETDLETKK